MVSSASKQPQHSLKSPYEYRFILIIFIVLLLIFLLTASFLYNGKHDRERQAETTTQNLAKELSSNLSRIFREVDLTLKSCADEYYRQIAGGRLNRKAMIEFLSRHKSRIEDGIAIDGHIRITDEEGWVLLTTGPDSNVKLNMSDREHFVAARDDSKKGLAVGTPVLGRIDKKWLLPFAFRLNKPDGSFAGVITMAIDIRMFADMIAAIQLGGKGAISIRDRNMGIIARYPEPGGFGSSIGKAPLSPEAAAIIKRGDKTATFRVYSAVDNIERIYSFRMLPNYPVYTFVGIASSDYLSDWYRDLVRTVITLLFLAALILFLARQMLVRWRHEIKNKEDLRKLNEALEGLVAKRTAEIKDSNERLRQELIEHKKTMDRMRMITTAVESASDAIGISNAQGHHFYQNRALSELFGYETAEELQAAGGGAAVVKEPSVAKEMFDNIMSGKPWTGELEMVAKDGRIIPAFERANAIKDDDGKVIGLIGIITDVTERKRAEDTLRIFKLSVENSSDAIGLSTPDGVHYYQNKAFDNLFGKIGERPMVVFADEAIGKEVFDTIMSGRRWAGEVKMFDKDRCIRDVFLNAYPNVDRNGRITALVGINTDITERKRSEETLRESEKLLSQTQEIAHVGSWSVDLSGTNAIWSEESYRIFGVTPDNFILTTDGFLNFIHTEDRPSMVKWLEDCTSGKHPSELECRIVRPDGTIRYVYGRGDLQYDQDGKPSRMVGSVQDITERKQAQEALQDTEQKFRNLFNDAEIGMFVTRLDGSEIIEFNQKYLTILGYSMDELRGKPSVDLWVDRSERDRMVQILKENGHVENYECSLKRKNGEIIRCITSLHLYPERGIVEGSILDITELKRAEERIKRLETFEVMGRIAGGVAHDLNNILGISVGYSDLLMDEEGLTPSMRSGLRKIKESGERAAGIVQDLLTMTRKGAVIRETMSLYTIVKEYCESQEFASFEVRHPEVKIKNVHNPELMNISGSDLHLYKLLMNLVTNAVEAVANGGTVSIMTENAYIEAPIQGYEVIPKGEYVTLTVSDTGEGISPLDLPHIFEPFYTRKKLGRSGTGLGLAVVWGVVKDHDGFIDVQTERGKGTTFRFYFPAVREKLPKEEIRRPSIKHMGHGEKILVVDDEQSQCELAQTMLSSLDYKATTVRSGEEAVEYLKSNQADLIILDMLMEPGMDGLDTYREILKIHPKQKALIVSGFAETERSREAQRFGAGAFVRKPYVKERLGSEIKRELERS